MWFWRYVCTSGSVVEYRLAKARVAGSNPVSCSFNIKKEISVGYLLFSYIQILPGSNGSKSWFHFGCRRRPSRALPHLFPPCNHDRDMIHWYYQAYIFLYHHFIFILYSVLGSIWENLMLIQFINNWRAGDFWWVFARNCASSRSVYLGWQEQGEIIRTPCSGWFSAQGKIC